MALPDGETQRTLSRDDESQGESNSIINQKAFWEDYAKRNSFTNIRHFTDDGVSGTTFDRKGFQAMIAEVEVGAVATIIVKDMSRFGRDYLKVGLYTDILFKDKGVRFIAINNGIDSDKQGDNNFTPFLNIMNIFFIHDSLSKQYIMANFYMFIIQEYDEKRKRSFMHNPYQHISVSSLENTCISGTNSKIKAEMVCEYEHRGNITNGAHKHTK